MKKLLLAALLTTAPLCHAENVAQITGGNYIFADAQNQRLIFNFEPSVFENRTWGFDEPSDNATTQFTVADMPLKTLHSSEFHAYERVAGGGYAIVATYNPKQHRAMLMRPVYRPNVNDGERVRVWLPAVGWIVRVGGTVARSVLPPIITNCLASTKCKTVAAVVIPHLCAINYWGIGHFKEGFLQEIGFPESFCKTAEEEGYKPEQITNPQTGKQGKTYVKEYPYVLKGHWGKTRHSDCEPGHEKECAPEYRQILIGANSAEHARSIANDMCKKLVGTSYTGIDPNNHDNYGLTGKVKSAELKKDGDLLGCSTLATDDNGEDFIGPSFIVRVLRENYKEKIQMVDVVNLVSKDFKKNPTPYMNDKGQVGKDLRKAIKPKATIEKKDGTGGTVTASSPPYLDPKTGKSVQDNVRITATPSKKGDLPPPSSGGAGNGAGGSPSSGTGGSGNTGINNGGGSGNSVSVTTTPRPDKQSEAVTAGNNNPNGTNPKGSGSNGQGTEQGGSSSGDGAAGGGGKKGDGGGLDCSGEHRNTLACAQMGEVDTEQSFEVPTTTIDKKFEADNFLPTAGYCPNPKHVVMLGRTYTISYNWLCQFAQQIRMLIIGLAYLMAAYIIFAGKKD
ncbi:hypothetical protein LNQ82_04570 [Conchiformibius steedae DSM 2580]|uniref:TspB protein n=1 Tax=Conchiformibius steedae DSM 2580 TaxID=1121352 RepID=A0AAE9L115_9NEIS|nr:IgG-binding virulence factor TspB family protein [Conchiformibius steedae]QMT33764.1 hypothetical protein H3L98_01650 [Conchiformibius steedae]URD68425.1 hypothetical protein LNQ82_04570 [Conchiformibius steedae DSM 2580]